MADAIVTDGFWRKSLSAIRSLGKADVSVHVIGDSILTTGFWSRFCSKKLVATDAAHSSSAFGVELTNYLESGHFSERPVLFPMEDPTLRWVSRERTRLADLAHFLIPNEEALAIAWDKGKTLSLAEGMGLRVPKTYAYDSYDEFLNEIENLRSTAQLCRHIIKPATSSGSIGLLYPTNNLDTSILIDHWKSHGRLLIQRRLPQSGAGLCVSLLFDRSSACVAHFVHKRLAEYPISGGPSTSRISLYADRLVRDSVKLLSSLKWIGIAMVEWKIDANDGLPYLLEINPRFWGGLELAIRSGVDFPMMYYQACLDQPVKFEPKYSVGVVSRWIIPGELLRYLSTPHAMRENFLAFISGLPEQADEWDTRDIRGTLAAIICPTLSLVRRKYWKFLRR